MTAIANEHWHILLRNRYEYGVLVRQDYAIGDVYEYAYFWSPTRTHGDKVRVTLPGSQRAGNLGRGCGPRKSQNAIGFG